VFALILDVLESGEARGERLRAAMRRVLFCRYVYVYVYDIRVHVLFVQEVERSQNRILILPWF